MPEFMILGGDSAGVHHARQFGRRFGNASLNLVDRDWEAAIRAWVPVAAPGDQLVPAPTNAPPPLALACRRARSRGG